jgi:uncharacterized membrane protein YdbT with pleckstrin-like domain
MHKSIDRLDDDELKICEIHKHPFGIFMIYVQAFIGVVIALALAYFLLPSVLGRDTGLAIANGFMVFVIVVAAVLLLGATYIYFQSRLIVTDKNITQILQAGLFNRKISQLTMVNVEDVTSDQRGFFATIFDFGVLKIETAGEQVNFHFAFCPRPSYYAKIISDAREQYIEHSDDLK